MSDWASATAKRYYLLLKSFPALDGCPGIGEAGVDLSVIDRWACAQDPEGDDGVMVTAAFVLNLWSDRETWLSGKFDLWDALGQWDAKQLSAFQAWAADPWRP